MDRKVLHRSFRDITKTSILMNAFETYQMLPQIQYAKKGFQKVYQIYRFSEPRKSMM
jgi:hypothetical protein